MSHETKQEMCARALAHIGDGLALIKCIKSNEDNPSFWVKMSQIYYDLEELRIDLNSMSEIYKREEATNENK